MGRIKRKTQLKLSKKPVHSQKTKYHVSSDGCVEASNDMFIELFQQLKSKVVDMDLIQTMEGNDTAIFEVNGFLSKINKPEGPDSIVDFVLDLEDFLEKTTQVINLKRESTNYFDWKAEAMLQKWELVSQSQRRITYQETKAKDKDRLASLEVNILTWTQHMDALQQKIEVAEKEKVEIDALELASIKKKLVEEANARIKHTKTACDLEKEVNRLKAEDVMNDRRGNG